MPGRLYYARGRLADSPWPERVISFFVGLGFVLACAAIGTL